MPWHKDSITLGEIDALTKTAKRAWADDTRYPIAMGTGLDVGQCYVTACWLRDRLGGYVGRREGHYAWLSPGGAYVLDIASHGVKPYYGENNGFEPVEVPINARAKRFSKRANHLFDNLDLLLKIADMTGDAFPGEEPQRSEDLQYLHDEPDWEPAQGEYRFVYGGGQLEVSPLHKHEELAEHAGLGADHAGPMAMGYIVVTNNKATWETDSNMNVSGLNRIFKDYTKHVGWDWGGITNVEGEPISDEFAPKKGHTLHYVYDREDDHLWIGRAPVSELALRSSSDLGGERDQLYPGKLRVLGRSAYVYGDLSAQGAIRSLYDYCEDNGLILYAANDNVLKHIPDLEQFNLGDPNGQGEDHQYPAGPQDEREPSGVYRCPVCQRLFPGWYEYQEHRKKEGDDYGQEPVEDGGFPEPDMDATSPTHFTEQQPNIIPMASKEAARVYGYESGEGDHFVAYLHGSPIGYARVNQGRLSALHASSKKTRTALLWKVSRYAVKEPKDLLEAPMPFIYDVQKDEVTVGHPGTRTSDIPGRFTPGGIVEGTYEPGGKVILRSMTSQPYTVRHLVQLWYYSHPELSVQSVHLQDDEGGTTKLASDGVGGYVSALVASDPAAHAASQALQAEGGKVYAVGGAVRDAVIGIEPKDIDLMVQGLKPADVQAILNGLPGRTDVTGRDFGVFRYRHQGSDVEIALPRKERSTGPEHRDFHVQADPNLSPEEDFYRRDFSANAMGVDLANGRLIDPYGGVEDIRRGVLRAHNPDSLKEDPLRVVRALAANARHGLVPDDATRQQMAEGATSLEHLPAERVQAELDKIFSSPHPHHAIRLAQETGVLPYLLPEVSNAFGFNQNNPHHELELGDHLTRVLERATEKTGDPDLRLAALLHDIGKPASAWPDPETGSNHYYRKIMPDGTEAGADHEEVGAEMTRNLLNRLRYPKDRVDRISQLVRHHMFPGFTTEKGARKFLNRVEPHADDLLTLRWADQGGKSEYPTDPSLSLDMQKELIDRVRNQGQATNKSQLAIDGNDLIRLGIPQGPQIGDILRRLTEAVVENPELNSRDQLLTMASEHATL